MGKVSVKRVMEIDEFCGRGASTKQIGKVFIRGNLKIKKKRISVCFTWSSSTWIKKVCVRGHKDEENLEVK